jgi:hypothetical protein
MDLLRLYQQDHKQETDRRKKLICENYWFTTPLALFFQNTNLIPAKPMDRLLEDLAQLLEARHAHLSQLALVDFETHRLDRILNGALFTNHDNTSKITAVTISRSFSKTSEPVLQDIDHHPFASLSSFESLVFLDLDIHDIHEFEPLSAILLATNLMSLRLQAVLSQPGLSHFKSMSEVETKFNTNYLPDLKVSLKGKPLQRFSLSSPPRFFPLITPLVTTIVKHPALERLELHTLAGQDQFFPDGNQLLNEVSRAIHADKQTHLQVLRLQGWCLSHQFLSDVFPKLLSLNTLFVENTDVIIDDPLRELKRVFESVQFASVSLKCVVFGFLLHHSQGLADDHKNLNLLFEELMEQHKDLFLACDVRLVSISFGSFGKIISSSNPSSD